MIIKSPKVAYIYLTEWNERIGGRRVGAGRDLSRVLSRTSFPLILAHSLSPLSSPFRPSRPPNYSRRRVATPKTESVRFHKYISETRIDIPSPGLPVARIIPPLSSFHEPATKYHRKLDIICSFFLFFFAFALNIN